jgi:hypothetical protein
VRIRVSSFSRSKPPDRSVLELLVRLCAGEIQSRCAIKSQQMSDRGHCVQMISTGRRIQLVNTVAARSSRNYTAMCFAFLPFAVSLAFLAATAALDAGVTPNYQIQLDSLR